MLGGGGGGERGPQQSVTSRKACLQLCSAYFSHGGLGWTGLLAGGWAARGALASAEGGGPAPPRVPRGEAAVLPSIPNMYFNIQIFRKSLLRPSKKSENVVGLATICKGRHSKIFILRKNGGEIN